MDNLGVGYGYKSVSEMVKKEFDKYLIMTKKVNEYANFGWDITQNNHPKNSDKCLISSKA